MPSNINQEIESHYFELFRKTYQLPQGKIEKDRDKPDIIIHGERKLGIEIRNIYIEEGRLIQSEQKQKDIRRDVIQKAHQQYLRKGGRHEVYFSFNKNHPITNSRKLIPKIVEMVFKMEAIETGFIRISNYFSDIPEISSVNITPNINSDPQWIYAQCHSGVATISLDNLEKILKKKEEQAKDYEKCDAYWLLIVIDSFDRAQEQLLPEEFLNGEVKLASDVYQKIILFLNQEQQILHLKE